MATSTSTRQWVCLAILALLGSTLAMAHMVKPTKVADLDHEEKPPKPARLRKLQMDGSGEDESLRMDDGNGAQASGCDGRQAQATTPGWEEGGGGIYGGGHGSGGATFGFHKINPFPAFPFGAFVPEVSSWGEGGGYGGGSNAKSGTGRGVQCHCSNGYAMQYTMSPINFPPMAMDPTMRRTDPEDMAPTSSP
ncbi:unnamed protein product [Lactuca saligna]|uniref:Glycine-rich protein n=1 Tax=Lactuca saligna TaxID=75948 RepID=A0AA36E2P3_LACSI|nr:unnamed protein product [Lactuca saligna]